MKLNRILISALAMAVFVSCTTEEDINKNQIFLTAGNFREEVRVAVDEKVDEMSAELSVAVAQPCAEDLTAGFEVASDLLEHYREAYYDPAVELLDAEYYDLGEASVIIKSGDVKSQMMPVAFKNLKNLDFSKSYVLPLRMVCEGLPVLKSASVMYYVVKKASLVNTAADLTGNCAWPEFKDFNEVSELSEFTMECLINAHAFNNKEKIHTIMGIEDHFLIRVGDLLLPSNQIQIAAAFNNGKTTYRKDVTSAALQLNTDRWYHLAVTFNKGVVDVFIDGNRKVHSEAFLNLGTDDDGKTIVMDKVNLKVAHSDENEGNSRCFWIGYSYADGRNFDGMIAEARIWNKVLTQDELKAENHFYKLYNPETIENLLAYWKFNEAKGKFVKDYSRYGHNLTADHDFVWYPVSLPANK